MPGRRKAEYLSKFETLRTCIHRLLSLKKEVPTLEEYLASWIIKDAVERNLHRAIETVIDLGKMLVVDQGFRLPESNREVFLILAEEG